MVQRWPNLQNTEGMLGWGGRRVKSSRLTIFVPVGSVTFSGTLKTWRLFDRERGLRRFCLATQMGLLIRSLTLRYLPCQGSLLYVLALPGGFALLGLGVVTTCKGYFRPPGPGISSLECLPRYYHLLSEELWLFFFYTSAWGLSSGK